MGCVFSSPLLLSKKKLKYITSGVSGETNDVVSLCRERKRLVKKALKHRQVFADAHFRYTQSLSSLSSAISVFVARYSSSPSQFFITFHSSNSAPPPQIPATSEEEEDDEEEEEEERESGVCDHFYDEVEGGFSSVEEECKWDFFNLLDEKKIKEEREIKGKLNEIGKDEKMVNNNGRELLEALKDVEDHFLRACESGMEVSRMLEVEKIPSHSTFEDIKDNASRKRSVSSRSSSCKSLLSSSSRSTSSTWAESGADRRSLLSCSSDTSSTWTENKSEALDGHSGMVSGSHFFTLGRLYAWEKKLYHEVKAGQQTRKTYKQKCSQLQQKDVDGDDLCPSKASSEVTDLYHVMLVSLQRAESISKQIEKLRDEELQPQLFELLHGLLRTWNSMLETHDIQRKIMREINSFSCPEHGKFCSDSHRLATIQLEAVIQDWHYCFSDYVSAQKTYAKSLLSWLSKFIDAEAEYHYTSSFSLPPIRFNGPTLIVTCQRWSTSLERLPDKSVKYAMKSLAKDLQALSVQQGAEQQQRRKVDGLDKEINRKILTFGKAEDKALLAKYTAHHNAEEQVESLVEKKQLLQMFKEQVEMERERYFSTVQETERMTMERLQMGFSSVFESLVDFARASTKVYADLVTFSQNAKV
ncbi:protein ALTERED PHOSPHATE STARVATION RESPONSE 1 [Beta vulgaris subsp. vulgaris]|uniref:protein ALTERED PHOSPHATE STARVATION RESPONSE 1 n=1 Tax=Beta vulgaris subsp. vulgaris TaxID=3555 RepID=UPI002036C0BF|nr:protein ALTERED PHOSPHATE STARVATION RESPONSE 1 [Beta vulgaris subsp. vulgaris]